MLTMMLQDLVGEVMEYHLGMDCKCCENKQMWKETNSLGATIKWLSTRLWIK